MEGEREVRISSIISLLVGCAIFSIIGTLMGLTEPAHWALYCYCNCEVSQLMKEDKKTKGQ